MFHQIIITIRPDGTGLDEFKAKVSQGFRLAGFKPQSDGYGFVMEPPRACISAFRLNENLNVIQLIRVPALGERMSRVRKDDDDNGGVEPGLSLEDYEL